MAAIANEDEWEEEEEEGVGCLCPFIVIIAALYMPELQAPRRVLGSPLPRHVHEQNCW